MKASFLVLPAAILLVLAISTMGGQAAWTGDATSGTEVVHLNQLESLKVLVRNNGTAPIEVTLITFTIRWSGSAVPYEVFSGSAMVEADESREFASEPQRMPDDVEDEYHYTITVKAVDAEGQAQERKFVGTLTAKPLSLSILGLPEAVLVPGVLCLLAVLTTLLFFRPRRSTRFPYLRAEPRLSFHRSRRT